MAKQQQQKQTTKKRAKKNSRKKCVAIEEWRNIPCETTANLFKNYYKKKLMNVIMMNGHAIDC